MSLSDKDLLTGSDQCEPRWKDDFEKSVGLAFFHMLCFCSYLSVPSCPYQSLFSLVNTNFLLVYWSKQNSLFTSRLTSLFRDEHSHIPIPQDSSIHTYIYSTQTTDHQTSTLCMRVCVCAFRCVNNGWGSQTLSESRRHSGSCYRRPPSE